jgi:hypothetical protein
MVKQLHPSRPETHQVTMHPGRGMRPDAAIQPLILPAGDDAGRVGPSACAPRESARAEDAVPRVSVRPSALLPDARGRYISEVDGEARQDGRADATARNRAERRALVRRRGSNERILRGRRDRATGREAGMATAEYAIATLAAVGFAALLVAVLSSGEIKGLLMSLITSALNFG